MASNPTFPDSLVTARLELRRYNEADSEQVTGLIDANRDHLHRNFPELAKGFSNADETQSFFKTCAAQWNEGTVYCYGIWTKAPHALTGQIKVKSIHWEIPGAELSYFVGQSFLRRGYATEAVLAVLNVAFKELKFNRVYARIIPSNIESLRLVQKIGMQHEGLHRDEFRCGFGELHDVHYYSFTRDEYIVRVTDAGKTTQ